MVSVIKITDNIYLNAKSDDEVIVELELYSDTRISNDLEIQTNHTLTLIQTIDLVTELLTDINDRDNIYKRVDLYQLGNSKSIYLKGFRFKCEIIENIFTYTIKELA